MECEKKRLHVIAYLHPPAFIFIANPDDVILISIS